MTVLDLNRVATFVKVVELGSFTAAAIALGVRKSSVSRSVAALEEELGTALLVRTTRKLSLTEGGNEYYERVRRAMSQVHEATETVRGLGQEPRGYLRITAAPNFDILSTVLARFVRRYPKIQVEVCLTSRAVDLVEERFDLALRGGQLVDSSLVGRKIATSHFGLFASPEYLVRRGVPKSLSDIAKHDCVVYKPSAGGKSVWRLEGPRGAEAVDVRATLAADEMGFLLGAVIAGSGIAMLVSAFAQQALARGEVVRVLPEYASTFGGLYVVWPASRHASAAATLLREFLIEQLSEQLVLA